MLDTSASQAIVVVFLGGVFGRNLNFDRECCILIFFNLVSGTVLHKLACSRLFTGNEVLIFINFFRMHHVLVAGKFFKVKIVEIRVYIRAQIYYRIGICCFSAKHAALKRKSKDWWARNQDIVSEWDDMSICGLLFQ